MIAWKNGFSNSYVTSPKINKKNKTIERERERRFFFLKDKKKKLKAFILDYYTGLIIIRLCYI